MNLSINEFLIYLAAAAVGYFLRNVIGPKPSPSPSPNLDALIEIIKQLLAQLKIFGDEARHVRSEVSARGHETKSP